MVSQSLDIELFNSDYLKKDQALVSHSADEDLKGDKSEHRTQTQGKPGES